MAVVCFNQGILRLANTYEDILSVDTAELNNCCKQASNTECKNVGLEIVVCLAVKGFWKLPLCPCCSVSTFMEFQVHSFPALLQN